MIIKGNLTDLELTDVNNKTIQIFITNKFGKAIDLLNNGTIAQPAAIPLATATTDANGNFSVNIDMSIITNRDIHIKISIPSIQKYFIAKITDYARFATEIDLYCFINMVDYDGFASVISNLDNSFSFIFTNSFLEKANKKMMGYPVRLSYEEKKMINKYALQADMPIDKQCSDVRQLNEQLGAI